MAEHAHTPPNPLPPILTLGMALAETEHAYRRLDESTNGGRRAEAALSRLDCREQALRALIASAPATTLADAAVQLGTACAYVGILDGCDWTNPATHARLADLHAALNRITLSVLPVVAAAAGLDLAAMVWDSLDDLRAALFFPGEARA